jgi:hypothetical protein
VLAAAAVAVRRLFGCMTVAKMLAVRGVLFTDSKRGNEGSIELLGVPVGRKKAGRSWTTYLDGN